MSEYHGPVYAPSDYAGFVRRTIALIVDALILLGLLFLIGMTAALFGQDLADEALDRRLSVAWVLLCVTYMLGFRMVTRGTPGYRIVGIEYRYMLAERPNLTTLLFRSVAALVLMWGFFLDHFWILFDERRQAWHDKLTGFYVVKRGAQPIARRRMSRRVIYFMMLAFVVWEPQEEDHVARQGTIE